MSLVLGEVPPLGLRERKKAKTRREIQAHALRLFRDHGYEGTTVSRIIEEAEVSESTFFRYFHTKAEIVLADDYDSLITEAFRSQPRDLSPIQALRASFREVFQPLSKTEATEQRDRMLLILSVPELRATLMDQFALDMALLAEVLGERTHRDPGELAVRTFAGAVIGASMAVLFALRDNNDADMASLMDEAMSLLESGLLL